MSQTILYAKNLKCLDLNIYHTGALKRESCFISLANKHGNAILDMNINLIKLVCPILFKSLGSVVNLSFDNGTVHGWLKKGYDKTRHIKRGVNQRWK